MFKLNAINLAFFYEKLFSIEKLYYLCKNNKNHMILELDLEIYFSLIGIKGSENGDTYDYVIGRKILSTFNHKGIFYAIDDESNTILSTLGEIKDFYKLPLIPDNVKTKEELEEYYRVIGLKS